MSTTQTIHIRVHPVGTTVQGQKGLTVRQILAEQGIYVDSPCDGQGICGQCKIRVQPSRAAPETPHANISAQEAQDGIRLACQLVPDDDLQVYLPPTYRLDARKTSDEGTILLGRSQTDGRIQPAVQVEEDDGRYWLRHAEEAGRRHPLSQWAADMAPKGLALDLGTTTLAASLICLETGRELASAGRLNPQVDYGHDVLTRIQRASSTEGLELLASAVQTAIRDLVREICEQAGAQPMEILDAVIGGNTTMVQICAREDPSPLGQLPFTVGLASGCSHPASRFGLGIHPQGTAYVPPILHAFVGSDISAGLVAVQGFFGAGDKILFLDVGTNGEMGVSTGQVRLLTSTAAGPAFEGSGLRSGMRAAAGAIQEVSFDGRDLVLQAIGNGHGPLGICGSGLLDLVHTLLGIGVLDPSGRLRTKEELTEPSTEVLSRLQSLDGKAAVSLADGVWLTQGDVRQLQLAKGAIRTGIDFLLDQAGLESRDLDRVVVGGGFGNVLRPASLEGVGMLPPETADKVVFAGNTSQLGCARLLVSTPVRRRLEEDMAGVEHIGLAQDAGFMDAFVANMEFPEPGANTVDRALIGGER
ncbi:ASKHA domain-containing protein [Desulfovermiculus halophilus]|uniref:ASKHA domain-containing protein n=1 Tax=Desulfovermiculus halophilus TaxID=339722 RepID=UPI0013766B58|nr:ASKHA domain-containing protein [Desulfovermiculus halophilus]